MRHINNELLACVPVDVYLVAVPDGRGYLWWVSDDAYGFVVDAEQELRLLRAATLRQLSQAAGSDRPFRLHAASELAGAIVADVSWAAQQRAGDREGMSVATLGRWLDEGQLALHEDAHVPDGAVQLAAQVAKLAAARTGRRWSDCVDALVDLPTGSQLRAAGAASGRTVVYCDGSARVKPLPDDARPGGWAWWIDSDTHACGPMAHSAGWSWGAEVAALTQAAEHAPGDRLLVTDAARVVELAASRRGRRHRFTAELMALVDRRDIELAAMPGHADPVGHNLADELAGLARRHLPSPWRPSGT